MRNIIYVFVCLMLIISNASAQNSNAATLKNNSKVDGDVIVGGTKNVYYYSDRPESKEAKRPPCESKTTGNVLLKNNSNKVMYVYYNTVVNEFRFVDPITIKPFESELIYDLPVGQSQEYKAVTVKPASRTSMHYIQGETGGRFSPDPCSTREFIISL